MKEMKSLKQQVSKYTDEEVNELAEWLEDLTLKQCFFLKESFEAYLQMAVMHEENKNVH